MYIETTYTTSNGFIFHPTPSLRWKEKKGAAPVLQQAWVLVGGNEVEWRDVPIVKEWIEELSEIDHVSSRSNDNAGFA